MNYSLITIVVVAALVYLLTPLRKTETYAATHIKMLEELARLTFFAAILALLLSYKG